MNLREALVSKGYDEEGVNDVITDMVAQLNDGDDPEDILFSEGLEPDYVFDLLEEAM